AAPSPGLCAPARGRPILTHLPGRIPVIPGPMNITPSRVLARASVAAHGSLLLVLAACTAPAPTPEADLLILNARVYTLTWGEPARGRGAAGGTPSRGLSDARVRLASLGASLAQVGLGGVETELEAVERVAARAAQVPPGEWIIGYGWDEGAWADRYPDHRL